MCGLVEDGGDVEQEAHGLAVEVAGRFGAPASSEGARLTQVEFGELDIREVGAALSARSCATGLALRGRWRRRGQWLRARLRRRRRKPICGGAERARGGRQAAGLRATKAA